MTSVKMADSGEIFAGKWRREKKRKCLCGERLKSVSGEVLGR